LHDVLGPILNLSDLGAAGAFRRGPHRQPSTTKLTHKFEIDDVFRGLLI
jgi:hypothetical protein